MTDALVVEALAPPGAIEASTAGVVRRFVRHKPAVVALAVIVVFAFAAILAPVLTPYDPAPALTRDVTAESRQQPSWSHPFGTDLVGRDQLTRVLYALRASLLVGLGVAALSAILGVIVGALAGYYRGWIDALLMRLTDLVLVLPTLALFLILANNPEPSFFGLFDVPPATKVTGMIIVLSVIGWMPMARIVRGEILSLRERDFVAAARASGASGPRIIVRHLLPNTAGPIVVFTTLAVGVAILNESVLSFLGAGVQIPDVSLGQLIADGETSVGGDLAYLFYLPGLVLFVLVLAVNFVGDGLRDALDPRATDRVAT